MLITFVNVVGACQGLLHADNVALAISTADTRTFVIFNSRVRLESTPVMRRLRPTFIGEQSEELNKP